MWPQEAKSLSTPVLSGTLWVTPAYGLVSSLVSWNGIFESRLLGFVWLTSPGWLYFSQELYDAGVKRKGTDVPKWISIMTERSVCHLQKGGCCTSEASVTGGSQGAKAALRRTSPRTRLVFLLALTVSFFKSFGLLSHCGPSVPKYVHYLIC